MKKICIIDYGCGNIGSLSNMLKYLKIKHVISSSSKEINSSTHYIIPGVGAFKTVMENFKKKVSISNLEKNVFKKKKPIMGICAGMQILASHGYENGKSEGLNWIQGEVLSLNSKVLPHMGWNSVNFTNQNQNLFDPNFNEFYFVHSYHFVPKKKKVCLGSTFYGEKFNSVVLENNILGVQFHPEKSQQAGLNLIKNFCK